MHSLYLTLAEFVLNTLRITEIFLSLQGESCSIGFPTTFVRLTGCPLRCSYCDSAYAFSGGEVLDIDAVVEQVERHGVRHVCVTGGEPLAQRACLPLLERLCDKEYTVSLETSGALDISEVDSRVVKVMDLKTPSSGEEPKNYYENIDHLSARDQVKFVIGGRLDYLWAKEVLEDKLQNTQAEVLFSPSFEDVTPRQLADWIVEDKLAVRFQLQLHKVLWGDEP
ncbi:MAG: 7-carboxy-7-deazaguanine synthase QueE, partial [Gammaproteobacteria bacterium]|nr:7-carboxy-7-deazaguanine synthase QueE [Gammaproteobacteria bacterium]